MFTSKPDRQTYGLTYGRTDISIYRVATTSISRWTVDILKLLECSYIYVKLKEKFTHTNILLDNLFRPLSWIQSLQIIGSIFKFHYIAVYSFEAKLSFFYGLTYV